MYSLSQWKIYIYWCVTGWEVIVSFISDLIHYYKKCLHCMQTTFGEPFHTFWKFFLFYFLQVFILMTFITKSYICSLSYCPYIFFFIIGGIFVNTVILKECASKLQILNTVCLQSSNLHSLCTLPPSLSAPISSIPPSHHFPFIPPPQHPPISAPSHIYSAACPTFIHT